MGKPASLARHGVDASTITCQQTDIPSAARSTCKCAATCCLACACASIQPPLSPTRCSWHVKSGSDAESRRHPASHRLLGICCPSVIIQLQPVIQLQRALLDVLLRKHKMQRGNATTRRMQHSSADPRNAAAALSHAPYSTSAGRATMTPAGSETSQRPTELSSGLTRKWTVTTMSNSPHPTSVSSYGGNSTSRLGFVKDSCRTNVTCSHPGYSSMAAVDSVNLRLCSQMHQAA